MHRRLVLCVCVAVTALTCSVLLARGSVGLSSAGELGRLVAQRGQWVHYESPCFVQMPVLFAGNSAKLSRPAKEALDNLIACARTHDNPRIVLDGHCATSEPVAIALRRALAAREYLITWHGFAGDKIIVRSFAQSCPVGDERNLRVEYFVLPPYRQPNDIVKEGCRDQRE
jgi:outer membrane protein OmpA-like peptidoglycan-associated protein